MKEYLLINPKVRHPVVFEKPYLDFSKFNIFYIHTPGREKLLFIQPGIDPGFSIESLVGFADSEFILRGVKEKNAESVGFGHRNINHYTVLLDFPHAT